MLCTACQSREASVPLTRVDAGGLMKLDLCASCAGQLQPECASVCLACGLTLSDLERTGRPGCPECYAVFREQLAPIVADCQQGERHLGKVPVRLTAPMPGA